MTKPKIDFGNNPIYTPASTAQRNALRDAIGLPPATQQEAEEGTETELRSFSPERIAQAIAALGGGGGASQNELTLLAGSGSDPGSFLGYSNGNPTPTFSGFGVDDCNPIIAIGGSALTSLSFSYCAYSGAFSLPDTSGLTALTSLSFSYCGSDTFSLPDTSGLTALTSLSFSNCGYFGTFSLPDTSGLTALTSLSFSNCGYFGVFSIVDSTSLLPESVGLLILEAVDNGSNIGIGQITLHVTGTSSLQTVITSLESKGYIVTLTTP